MIWQQKSPHKVQQTLNIHHALKIAEILENIFGFLAKKDLLNLALTSRAFEDCAIDALWGNFEISVEIILQPLKAAKVIKKKGLLPPPHLSRPPSPKEFSRFLSYVRRIKSLSWDAGAMRVYLFNEMFHTLFSLPQTRLPRLRKLVYTQGLHDDMSQCFYFMTDSLKDLAVFRKSTEDLVAWSRCLSALPTRCPNLTSLGLHFRNGNRASARVGEIEQLLGGILPNLHRIRSFRLLLPGGVSEPFFRQLGHIPLLTDLAVTIYWNLHPFCRGAQPTPSFLHLERLRIVPSGTVETLENFSNLFLGCREAPLTELVIPFTNRNFFTSSSSFVRHALKGYSESDTSRPSLKVVMIVPYVFEPSPEFAADEDHHIGIIHLTPLFRTCYRNLEQLRIELPLIYDLVDDDLILLGSHLPKLTILSLAHKIGDVMKDWPDPLVTLRGLIALANKCPGLRYLALAVTLFAIPGLSEPPPADGDHPVPALCMWNVVNSTVSDAEEVAITLALRLPRLVDLREMDFSWAVLGAQGQSEPGYSFAPLDSDDPWVKRSRKFSVMGRFLNATRSLCDRSPNSLRLLWVIVSKRWEEAETSRKKKAVTLHGTVKRKLSSLFRRS